MISFFNQNNNQQNQYVSDYPQVIYTNNKNTSLKNQTEAENDGQQGFVSSILNSDIIKQIIPFLLGSNTNSKRLNILSLLQNFNPNLSEMVNSLSLFNNNNKKKAPENKTQDKGIIDLSDYEDVTNKK